MLRSHAFSSDWNADEVLASYYNFVEGRSAYSGELWRIICTELWLRQCIELPGKRETFTG